MATIHDRVRWDGSNVSFHWCWSRSISGRLLGYITNLTNRLSSFVPCRDGTEEWYWELSNNGLFSVQKLTKLIERMEFSTPSVVTPTARNRLVPLKFELFVWRAMHNRLPTRVELDKRGIDLGSIRCPVCDDALETVEHSLIHCKEAGGIWFRVIAWWN
ncbi:uncharacterized protein [Rutidosis leptorrhynchoides]|uniref:uncharacterized protein n=1 Tax=Rutidosis leptorrhynchoides TaxID=125765 RepID=UPI003A996AD3